MTLGWRSSSSPIGTATAIGEPTTEKPSTTMTLPLHYTTAIHISPVVWVCARGHEVLATPPSLAVEHLFCQQCLVEDYPMRPAAPPEKEKHNGPDSKTE